MNCTNLSDLDLEIEPNDDPELISEVYDYLKALDSALDNIDMTYKGDNFTLRHRMLKRAIKQFIKFF